MSAPDVWLLSTSFGVIWFLFLVLVVLGKIAKSLEVIARIAAEKHAEDQRRARGGKP